MDYSNHKDAKGSKVLKVALSAALAAAFTPMAAIPAFAVEGTGGGSGSVIAPKSAAECISSALAYDYSTSGSAYTYNGALFADGTTLLGGFTPAQAAADGSGVMNDMARFLGALYRFDSGTSVKAIKYGNAKYVWNGTANLKGSNWVIENAATQGNTLVAAITKDLAAGLLKNYGASVTLGISSDDGTSYTNITLKTSISTAKLTHDGKTDSTVYSLEEALTKAASGDTVTMTSDTITKTQLSLPAGVTLDGNGKTLTHLSNDNINDKTKSGERGAIQLLAQDASDSVKADTAAIKNLTIVGPNSDTKNWTSGEFGIKAYGAKADLIIQDVTINRAQTAIQATMGAEVTIKNSLKIGDVELGGIEVSEDANSELVLDESAKITYSNETAATPFAWVDNGGSITNYTNLELAKVDKTAIDGKAKFHYYLNASDSNGAHFYTDVTDLKNDTLSSKSVTLGAGSGEYALVKFVPSTSGTYYFASEGTVDAAAELYTMAANGGLGTKITQGDDEQGYSFKLCATLTAGSSYILKVYSLDKTNEIKLSSGTVDTASLSNYTVERTSTIACYDDENLMASSAKLAVKVTSLADGKTLAADKYTATIWTTKTDNTKDTEVNGAITKAGRYILEVTPKEDSNLKDSAYCYFNVLDSKDISNYDFKYTTAVIYNGQAVSIKTLAPKGYRMGTSTLVFDESNIAVEGWYSVDKDGNETKLANAPSAVGNYVLKVLPSDTSKYSGNDATELPFSITKGKVTAPTAKTGLVYTGKAQTGVATGTGYTLSGTASATDAGSYTCTATLAEGYSWADGTLAPKTFTWSIAKAKIAVPTAVIGLVYTGKAQSGVATGTGYTLSGTTSATEPGDYTATATPTANYTWTDGTTTAKQVKWTLSKAQPGISATPSTVAIAAGGKASVTLKQAGTASYSVASSDTKVATASVSGSTVSISAVASGTAKITVSTAADKHYAAGSAVITVNVPKVKGATDATTNTVVQPDGTAKTVIDAYVVTKAPNLADSSVVPTVKFTGTTATGAVTIPASVTLSDGFTYKVTAIDADAFYGSKVTAVTISAGVTRIGNSAFEDCTKLASVTIPSSVTVVGKGAFDGCTKLAKVRVINGKIYKNAFKGCKKLGTITIGKKVKSIGANAFKNTKAKTVTLKSAKLSKTSIKNLVKGSKITTIKGTGLSKKVKAKYAKWAKAYKANIKVK